MSAETPVAEVEEQQGDIQIPLEQVNRKLAQRIGELAQQEATATAAVDVLVEKLNEANETLERLAAKVEELEEKVKPRKAS